MFKIENHFIMKTMLFHYKTLLICKQTLKLLSHIKALFPKIHPFCGIFISTESCGFCILDENTAFTSLEDRSAH